MPTFLLYIPSEVKETPSEENPRERRIVEKLVEKTEQKEATWTWPKKRYDEYIYEAELGNMKVRLEEPSLEPKLTLSQPEGRLVIEGKSVAKPQTTKLLEKLWKLVEEIREQDRQERLGKAIDQLK